MRRIEGRVTDHRRQRYDTVGDWENLDFGGSLVIKVSQMKDWRSEAAVFLHEFVEAMLCERFGITDAQVDAWDLAHPEADEPGDLPDCPYNYQHAVATMFELYLIEKLGLTWAEHEANCNAA